MRVSAIAGLAGLLAFFLIFAAGGPAPAARANAPALQDTPGYNPPGDGSGPGNGYNPPATDLPSAATSTTPATPAATSSPATATKTSTVSISLTPTPTATLTLTPTLPPDQFRTEDAEMNNSQATPLASETPGPTLTLFVTPTVTKTPFHPTPTQAAVKKKDGLNINWGLFWIGFSLPVLAACGVVLYLLDRRPGSFKRFW